MELIIMGLPALLFLFVLMMNKGRAAYADQWLLAKKSATVSCGPYGAISSGKLNGQAPWNQSPDHNKGNGCSHQQGVLCDWTSPKRRILQVPQC